MASVVATAIRHLIGTVILVKIDTLEARGKRQETALLTNNEKHDSSLTDKHTESQTGPSLAFGERPKHLRCTNNKYVTKRLPLSSISPAVNLGPSTQSVTCTAMKANTKRTRTIPSNRGRYRAKNVLTTNPKVATMTTKR
jgi:hypothetical protein